MAMDAQIRPNESQITNAHAQYDKTRCAAWLLATGNRPVGGVTDITLAKQAVAVYAAAVSRPEFGCDIHQGDE